MPHIARGMSLKSTFMKKAYRICMMIGFCCGAFILHAQPDSAVKKLGFKIGTYYNSSLNYYGRTDSVRSSGVFPMAELWYKNKLYVNAAPVFTHNTQTGFQYAGAVATAGFVYNNGKSAAHVYFTKPIYRESSRLVQSALKAQAAASFSWLNKFINITGGADLKFSNKTDVGLSAGIDHIFRKELPGKAVLVIDPSAWIYAGTRQLTTTHREKTGSLLFPGPDRLVTEEVKEINVLSYEFSVPVIYSKGRWMILATPAYVMPRNLVQVESRPDLSERGKQLFYITAGTRFSF